MNAKVFIVGLAIAALFVVFHKPLDNTKLVYSDSPSVAVSTITDTDMSNVRFSADTLDNLLSRADKLQSFAAKNNVSYATFKPQSDEPASPSDVKPEVKTEAPAVKSGGSTGTYSQVQSGGSTGTYSQVQSGGCTGTYSQVSYAAPVYSGGSTGTFSQVPVANVRMQPYRTTTQLVQSGGSGGYSTQQVMTPVKGPIRKFFANRAARRQSSQVVAQPAQYETYETYAPSYEVQSSVPTASCGCNPCTCEDCQCGNQYSQAMIIRQAAPTPVANIVRPVVNAVRTVTPPYQMQPRARVCIPGVGCF